MRTWVRKLALLLVPAVSGLAGTALQALAQDSHYITQKGRAFRPRQVEIAAGTTLEFNNEDEFIHQIYVDSEALDFDSAEQHPGEKVLVKFPGSGTFPVRCHIHPKMLLRVNVK